MMAQEEAPVADRGTDMGWVKTGLGFLKDILPVMTTIIGGLWVLFTYLDNQKHEADARSQQYTAQLNANEKEVKLRKFEARKPFLDKQFALYLELSGLVGRLLAIDTTDPQWQKDKMRLVEISSAEIRLLGDANVAELTEEFAKVIPFKNVDSMADSVGDSADKLTKALVKSIQESWRDEL
jgi:hypothetical protein